MTMDLLIYNKDFNQTYFVKNIYDMLQFVTVQIKEYDEKSYKVIVDVKHYKEKELYYNFGFGTKEEVLEDVLKSTLTNMEIGKYLQYSVWTRK
jgi:hypothetical protein